MIEEILPAEVASAVSRLDAPEAALFPTELALISSAAPRRRAEFTTARVCARQALARLGIAAAPILSGARREPIWPDGVVGSITHCAGYRAAAIGRSTWFTTIGIDAEPNEPLPDGLLEHISLPQERRRRAHADGTHLDRLLFSAKESVYKAWFPLTRRWLGFEQAAITLEPDGTFDAELLVAGPVSGFHGRWLARDELIVTAIATPRPETP
ncbi:4'-phosphopantetheinyl transferase family protein [Streptomyces prunicolor]|uniref:4'-phosphopantetheinyl transferase family protein n=1 Tax=Streptomyces prunicolor TaxID=67348 RepID=UPI000370507E|nr:4'-phosphopantetheinyl transferase superfamily protein [Streptomyces prunicolor]